MRHRRTLATVLALIPLLGVGVRADAHGGNDRFRTFRYEATAAGGTVSPGEEVCDSAGHCVSVQTSGGEVFGGDLSGTGVGGAALSVSEQSILAVTGTSTVVGGIRQCGDGTFVYTTSGSVDLRTGSVLTYTIEVVPGTGTGALEGMTGRATGRLDLADPDAVAQVKGWVRCRPRAA